MERSTWGVFMASRSPTSDEARLLRELAQIAGIERPGEWVDGLEVEEMEDGGMGSLTLFAPITGGRRGVISCMAAVQFTDSDGVEVVASLNANKDGIPIELDIWKTDFSRLIRIPDEFRGIEE